MPTITRGAAQDSSDGAPENSAPADVTIAGPFHDGDADFDDCGGAGMGTTEETAAMSAMSDQVVKMFAPGLIVKMGAIWQDPVVNMEAMQATTGQLQATQARRDEGTPEHQKTMNKNPESPMPALMRGTSDTTPPAKPVYRHIRSIFPFSHGLKTRQERST